MCHNEEKYPNASEFNPDRFLNPDGTLTDDTVSVVWGFGRRICPGRHLAEASLWSAMVCLLAVFKFSRARDETGGEIEIKPEWKGGLTSYVVFGRISVERYLLSDLLLQATPAIPLQYHSAERRNGYHGLATFDEGICLAWCMCILC